MIFSERVAFSFSEKRILAKFPSFPESLSQVQSFCNNIDKYLADHFGFRDFFIYRYQREVRKRFGIVGSQTIVHQGIESWLYIDDAKNLFDYAGKNPLSRFEIEAWKTDYEKKRAWLGAKGIKYVLIVAPNKQTVYPEYVMQDWQQYQRPGRLAQLCAAFPEIAKRELFTLGDSLKKVKSGGQVFHKTDTHWTPYGAYHAYLSVAAKIERFFPGEVFRRDFHFTAPQVRVCEPKEKQYCGDLAKMLLDFEPITEHLKMLKAYRRCAIATPFTYSLSDLSRDTMGHPTLVRRCPEKRLTALVFRDSFFSLLEPFLSENFKEVVYVWKRYDQKNVEEILNYFTPDIVIEERVERSFF